MKYLKLFENFDQTKIDKICKKYGIENYTINPDGSIDVDGDVDLTEWNLTKLPLKFNKVSGSFLCYDNYLTSLDGCPKEVVGNFNCARNNLTNLIGGPKEVGGYFDCSDNKLTSLDGCPKEVICGFHCADNKLTTLEGCPEKIGDSFNCQQNGLTNLDGCPREIGGFFGCSDNYLTSLVGSPKYATSVYCNNNELTTLEGCPNTDGFIDCNENPICAITSLFRSTGAYLEYQETYNFVRKDCKIVRHLLEEALKDYNEYYKDNKRIHKEIKGYTYI